MNEYKNRRQLLCLAVTAGMMFTAVNVSSKTVWAAAEQVIEYDPNQEEKTHPGLHYFKTEFEGGRLTVVETAGSFLYR